MPRLICVANLVLAVACFHLSASAQETSSVVAPLLKLLKSGKVPAERLPAIVEMVCRRGGPADLQYVFEESLKPDAYAAPLKLKVLDELAEAAETRKVKPAGDLGALASLVTGDKVAPAVRTSAIRLASIWKVDTIGPVLVAIALDEKADEDLRVTAITGLAATGGATSRETLEKLSASKAAARLRYLAVAALAGMDPASAAERAASVLAEGDKREDPGPIIDAFLNRKDGSDKLAAALAKKTLSTDVAKLALRYMYSVGRSDAQLSDVLSKAAGIAADPPPPTADDIKKLSAEVVAKGDAARGEKIFRRGDLSCMKCHAVSQAGGAVGPDLSAVGSTSPVEYCVTAILLPDQVIKEAFLTRIFQTAQGEVITGIVVDRDDDRVIVKDASGKQVKIPTKDIDDEAEGKSLMPKGLTKFLTREEVLDLSRFISELGKPGPYAIRTQPTMQRWRWLKQPAKELLGEIPNVEQIRAYLLDAKPDAWTPVYSKVAGALPLEELSDNPKAVLYVQGEFEVTEAGPIELAFDAVQGLSVWIDAEPFDAVGKISGEFAAGKHKITLRIDRAQRTSPELRMVLVKPEGSSAQFQPVVGP